MKKVLTAFFVNSVLIAFFLASGILSSCEGPAGPAGPQGEQGEQGIQGEKGETGEQGIPGGDGTAACAVCHNDETKVLAASIQYGVSTHAVGGNFERNGTSCAPCHTGEGFTECLAAGTRVTDAAISNPTPPSCRTCHKIHETFGEADWALATTAAVTADLGGEQMDFGKSNLCINCHQSRNIDPWPESGTVTVGSTRYGPHHGPQGNMLAGIGGYEVVGSESYANSMHTTLVTDGCVTCHMAEAYGSQAGGHTMGVAYEYHGHMEPNTAGCEACHTDEDELVLDIEESDTEIATLLTDLKTLLIAQGVFGEDDYAVTGDMTADQAGAIINYQFVREDRSKGAHNFKYAKALLTNSIEAITPIAAK